MTATCTMPDGTTRTRVAQDPGTPDPEYVVARLTGTSRGWIVCGWFADLDDATACEDANLKSAPRHRVALLAVDDPEGEQ